MSGQGAPVMILAGGTGGHIFPGLAVAEALRAREVPVVWLGSEGGMETRLVPPAGIRVETIRVRGLRGKGAFALLKAPFLLMRSLAQERAADRGFDEAHRIVRGPLETVLRKAQRRRLRHDPPKRLGFRWREGGPQRGWSRRVNLRPRSQMFLDGRPHQRAQLVFVHSTHSS